MVVLEDEGVFKWNKPAAFSASHKKRLHLPPYRLPVFPAFRSTCGDFAAKRGKKTRWLMIHSFFNLRYRWVPFPAET
jgi:hypothetical protein